MKRVSATEAARRFSEVLDAVESGRESFIVLRNGRPVASIGPAAEATGRTVKELLRKSPRDASWSEELRELRESLSVEDRPWSD